MLLTIWITTLVIAVLTLMPLSRSPVWWVRAADFPRVQLLGIAAAIAVFDLWALDLNSWPTALALPIDVACMVYHAWWIVPYTRIYPKEVIDTSATEGNANSLRLLVSNVLMTNRNSDALLALVRKHDPDILVTLETDLWWQQQLDVIEPDYPHTIKCPLDNLYGMHVYSKLPLHDAEVSFLVAEDIPSMHAAIELRSGRSVRAHFVHPTPPSPTENDSSSERDAELVIVATSVADHDGPVIVTGDLNDVAWSRTTRLFRKISGLLDPRVGRGMFNTFHAKHWYFRWPLDHLFHSEHFTLRQLCRMPSIGSDHFPLLTELELNPAEGAQQEGLEADSDDREMAREVAAEEGVSKHDVPKPTAG
jgi:endonuclease/exonuclease/phosphatase (EEP) superfamily protein YafD